jgi:hypothetical protein
MRAQWKTDRISALWSEINGPFLSLRGMADEYPPRDEFQKKYKQLLVQGELDGLLIRSELSARRGTGRIF